MFLVTDVEFDMLNLFWIYCRYNIKVVEGVTYDLRLRNMVPSSEKCESESKMETADVKKETWKNPSKRYVRQCFRISTQHIAIFTIMQILFCLYFVSINKVSLIWFLKKTKFYSD